MFESSPNLPPVAMLATGILFLTALSYEDMVSSVDFIQEIKRLIDNCHVFIPLISKNSIASDKIKDSITSVWLNQEIDYAVAKKRIIMPIKIDDTNPEGMIKTIHATPLKVTYEDKIALDWSEDVRNIFISCVKKHKELRNPVIKTMLKALDNSKDFYRTRDVGNALFDLLNPEDFTDDEINDLTRIATTNSQLYKCGIKPFANSLEKTINANKERIDKTIFEKFKEVYNIK